MDLFDIDPTFDETGIATTTEASTGSGDYQDVPELSIDEILALEEETPTADDDGDLSTETQEEGDAVRIPVTIKHEI